MRVPILLNIGQLNSRLNGIPLSDGWKIPPSKNDDIIWNIVLAYLNSFNPSNKKELTQHVKCLAGRQTVNKIKTSIKICNPFLHRSACLCDEEISKLVDCFKERVKEFIQDSDISHLSDMNAQFGHASSTLLSCNIVVISFPVPAFINTFPLSMRHTLPTVYRKTIVLFYEWNLKNGSKDLQLQLSFSVPKEVGNTKQRQALTEILRRTEKIERKLIQKISRLRDASNNFIISLLKNDLWKIIPLIYKSPYVISKLDEAGFQTDPRARDSEGKSAFYHALKTEESPLVSLLYEHAANACPQTDASVRSPDPVIVENLLYLKDHLKLVGKDLESPEISETSRCLFRDLCQFNEYQIEICKVINDIKQKINYYDQTEKEFETLQRKDTILAILKSYENYFDYLNVAAKSCIEVDDNISRFKEFYKYEDYFDKLDFTSAVMFFDNLFLLKERLRLPNTVYLDVESKFFLFIFCRKYFKRYERENYFYFVSRWIIFQERLTLKRQMCSFKEILQQTNLSKDTVIDKVQGTDVRTLTNLPEIYGLFLVFRLQHYLDVATETKIKDLKSILIIERCLQVLGEVCKESDFNSVQKIISLALPKDFITQVKQIRNHLIHIKSHELLHRNDLEQDIELFVGIQNELGRLKILLLPIYSAHKYEMDNFFLLNSIKSICKARRRNILERHENQIKAILPPPEMQENFLSVTPSSRQHPWKHYFDKMHKSLKKEIDYLNRRGNILTKYTINHYKHILQNIITSIREVLNDQEAFQNQEFNTKAVAEKVVKLNNHFWCLENILTYISKDINLENYRRPLLLMMKNRKISFADFNGNAHSNKLQKKHKSINGVINGQPVAEVEVIEIKQPQQSEEICNRWEQNANHIETFGVCLNIESRSSTFAIENEGNNSCHIESEGSESNTEIKSDHFEHSILQNMFDISFSEESTTKNYCQELNDSCENLEHLQTIPTEENYLPFYPTINMKIPCDWLIPNVYHYYSESNEADDAAEIPNVTRNWRYNSKLNTFIDEVIRFIDGYEAFAHNIFQQFLQKEQRNPDFCFESIEKFCFILKGGTILKKEEKESILQSVSKKFQNVPEIKQEVKSLLRGKTKITKEIKDALSKLNLKNQEIKEIAEDLELELLDEADRIVDSARDYFKELEKMVEAKEIVKSEIELLCQKLEIPPDTKNILLKLLPGQNKKVPGSEFEFLRNRIKMLKRILIDENSGIQQLWERATTPRRKLHVKEKIVQLYLKDSEIQVSVETLLFDCMIIMSSKELKSLWRKTKNLFNGINLKNVLAHGHPLLESLGRLLDPFDLPSELVDKMVKLISDEHVVDCMQQILDQSGNNFSVFLKIMNDEENEQFKTLREQILECDHWKEYAWVIPQPK